MICESIENFAIHSHKNDKTKFLKSFLQIAFTEKNKPNSSGSCLHLLEVYSMECIWKRQHFGSLLMVVIFFIMKLRKFGHTFYFFILDTGFDFATKPWWTTRLSCVLWRPSSRSGTIRSSLECWLAEREQVIGGEPCYYFPFSFFLSLCSWWSIVTGKGLFLITI